MSYIAFDLDALNVVPDVAAVAGISPAEVSYGLSRLWAWCFRQTKDEIQPEHVAAFFGGPEKATAVGKALELFGFLAPIQSGFRVKGADRYLRVREARIAGGKKAAAAGNLKRGGRKVAETPSPAALQLPSSSTPAALQLPPSSTPNTEHRTPNTEHRSVPGDKRPAPADPRHAPLVATLTTTFQRVTAAKYPFTARDAKAVSQLLALAIEPTIDATWAKALASSSYPLVRTLPELVTHFAHFVGATGPPGARRNEPTTPRPEGRVLL